MTDEWDTGAEEEFGEDFFASLESAPEAETADDTDDVFDDAAGPDEFHYEAEGDGSFETDAAEEFPDDLDADADDFPFDLGGEG
jgi:hypothetical protein